MKPTLQDIQNLMNNKRICLIGNSRSVLENKKDIDRYDIICRLNRGYPQKKEKYIGSRTDILFYATRIHERDIIRRFNPKYVICFSTSERKVTDWIRENAYEPFKEQWAWDEWNIMNNKLPKEARPTAGSIAVSFILNHINYKSLTIYGFDFFETGTWYHNLKGAYKAHNAKAEKELILSMIKNKSNVELIVE